MFKKLTTIITIFIATTFVFASGYDYSKLLNPRNLVNINTRHSDKQGNPIFDISFKDVSLESRSKLWNIKIPQTAVFKDLSLTVYIPYLNDDEIKKINYPRPIDIEAKGFSLKLVGKKSIVNIFASVAFLSKENKINLSKDATMSVGNKKLELGTGSVIYIKDKILYIKSNSAGQVGIRL